MQSFKLIFIISVLFLNSCSENKTISDKNRLSIFVASSSKELITKIADDFQKDKNITIDIYSTSSGKGYAQLINGFKYDIYFSADSEYPNKVYNQGLSEKPKVYEIGFLALYSKNTTLISKGILALTDDEVVKIAIANPKLAPYGKLGIKFLKNIKIYNKLKEKLILGENISQAVQFVDAGAVDIGIVAISLLKDKPKNQYLKLESKFYNPMKQTFVVTKYGKDKKIVQDFITLFVLKP